MPDSLPIETRAKIAELLEQGLSGRAVARSLGVSKSSVERYRDVSPEKPKTVQPDRIEEHAAWHKEKFLELQERFKKWIGDTDKVRTVRTSLTRKSRVKILELNDIHAPFHNEEALAQAINDNRDADECWIGGDLLDLFGVSRYPKSRMAFSLVEEFQAGRMIIKTLAETFPIVRVMSGNHDERWQKYLVAKNIPPDVLDFMKFAWPDSMSPLARLCCDLPNVHMMEAKKIDYAEYGYIHQFGDCLLSHAEKYSIVPGKTGVDVLDRCKKKLEPMGVVTDFKVLIQCHSHSAAKVWADYGVVIIEAGCLSRIPDYDSSARIMGRQPIVGYTVVYQENGATDRNASNFIQLV